MALSPQESRGSVKAACKNTLLIPKLSMFVEDGGTTRQVVVAAGGNINHVDGALRTRLIRSRGGPKTVSQAPLRKGPCHFRGVIEVHVRGSGEGRPYAARNVHDDKVIIVVMEPEDPLRTSGEWEVSDHPVVYGALYPEGIMNA